MAMAACQAQCLQASNYLPCAQQGSSSLEIRNRPAAVSFSRIVPKFVQVLSRRSSARLIVCAVEGSGRCCGGSEGNGSGKQSCSSHGSKAPPPVLQVWVQSSRTWCLAQLCRSLRRSTTQGRCKELLREMSLQTL